MDFEPYDSSGTDDDLPPSHQNRIPRGRLAGNGKSAVIGSAPYSRVYGETDMETEIRNIEKEAYVSVLRAFRAQADAISWEKEALITQLRRELRLSDDDHRDLLRRVNADDVIKRIREWRMAGGIQTGISTNQVSHDPLPSPAASASRKKQKIVQPAHQSFSGPSPHLQSQTPTSNPQSLSAAKRGQNNGLKGKKQKSLASSASAGRAQIANRVSSGVHANELPEAVFDPLIGRKVKTRWPDDNNFYEAIITEFDPAQGRHALVYDKGSANETWEWVNLAEISPSDIRWEGSDPANPRGGYGGPGHGMNRPVGNDGTFGAGSGRGIPKGQNRKDHPHTQNGAVKKGSNIRILQTSHLLKEVERVFNSSNPDPLEIDKAKKALKEQEEALIDALGKLADISDGESGYFELTASLSAAEVTRQLTTTCFFSSANTDVFVKIQQQHQGHSSKSVRLLVMELGLSLGGITFRENSNGRILHQVVEGDSREAGSPPISVASSFEMSNIRSEEGEEIGQNESRKKLRLSKDQSAFLEDSYKEHNTLSPKQKVALAKKLDLRPRQVEVWFQNRRARNKLKQTEVDCEYLKRRCETLTEENTRLEKELQDLRALNSSNSLLCLQSPATTLTMCPSCEITSDSSRPSKSRPSYYFPRSDASPQ
ncbi:hypothetical protein QQ045_016692 [Rhodiola kirilowii]